jgi:hypothetical protein
MRGLVNTQTPHDLNGDNMLRHTITAAAVTLGAAIGQLGVAQVQTGNTCKGRVVVDTIYQFGIGQGQFEYYFNIRNATRDQLMADVTLSGFPAGVTVFSPSVTGIPLGAYASRNALKFGRGTWAEVHSGTVNRVYDAAAPAGPTIRVTNCRNA